MKSLKDKLTRKVIAPMLIAGTLLTATPQIANAQDSKQNFPKNSVYCGVGSYAPNYSTIEKDYKTMFNSNIGVISEFSDKFELKYSLGYSLKKNEGNLEEYGKVHNRLNLFQMNASGNYKIPVYDQLEFYLGAGISCVGAQEKLYKGKSRVVVSIYDKIFSDKKTALGFLLSMGVRISGINFEVYLRHAKAGEDGPNFGGIGMEFSFIFPV